MMWKFYECKRRCVIIANSFVTFEIRPQSFAVSKLLSASFSVPCSLLIIMHLKGGASKIYFDTPPFLYTHGESNPNRRNRNPIFYPLNYGCFYIAKVRIFCY